MDLERWDDDVYDNVVQVLELEYSNHIVPVYNIIHHSFDVILLLLAKVVVLALNVHEDDDELSQMRMEMDNRRMHESIRLDCIGRD